MTVNPMLVKEHARRHFFAKESIKARYPDLAEDDEAFLDTLEGESSLLDIAQRIVDTIDERQIIVTGCSEQITKLGERKSRNARAIEALKELLFEVLQKAGERKVTLPNATLILARSQPKLVVVDENLIPERFKVKQPDTLDKKKIIDAMKGGEEVQGALLSNGGEHLVFKRS